MYVKNGSLFVRTCLSESLSVPVDLLVTTHPGFASGSIQVTTMKKSGQLPRSRQTADRAGEPIASQQRLAQEATAPVTAPRGATIAGAAAESPCDAAMVSITVKPGGPSIAKRPDDAARLAGYSVREVEIKQPLSINVAPLVLEDKKSSN